MKLSETKKMTTPTAPDLTYTVDGTVSSPDRAGVSGLQVSLVDKNAGPDVQLATGVTDNRGRYRISVVITGASLAARSKTQPDLQARVSTAAGVFVAASKVHYNASVSETLDVAIPARSTALPSEYESLAASLAGAFTGQLATLQENGARQDVTYLANKTGWDARAVAMAALSAQFAQPANGRGPQIRPEFYYALFRAGYPANADILYQADPKRVSQVWTSAIVNGVIPATLRESIATTLEAFTQYAVSLALTAKPLTGLSPLKDMLTASNLDPKLQSQFADLYVRYQGDHPTFWANVQKLVGADVTKNLQLDGQLHFLTLNNGPMVGRLHAAEAKPPMQSTLDLARRGYYDAAKWAPLIGSDIPPQITGANTDERARNYANTLAAQVRISFPTAVVSDMVRRGIHPVNGPIDVANFLDANQGKFEIGVEPLEHYLAHNKVDISTPVKTEVKRLQRVYQITPTDAAMSALLSNKIDSAYQITRYGRKAFVRSFSKGMGGDDVASKTYDKAEYVYNAVLNITHHYFTKHKAPPIGSDPSAPVIDPGGGGSGGGGAQPAAQPASPVEATIQQLFGSIDYCNCSDCRSILSPAAYLVDLLQFIDVPAPQKQNPQAVLFGRRPDIQFLPLTCENTNVALPYIDLVNEILLYFVANNLSLANFTGHDTGSQITSEELLASAQYDSDSVAQTAYGTLESTYFPPPLPMHRPLEQLRLHFDKFGVQLEDAMAALRPTEAIDRGATAAYAWRDIVMEQAGFSRPEYQILTDSSLTLQQLYGYPNLSGAALITALSSFQDFSRRTGVSYDDLISILKTRFVNPNCVLIPKLERLNVPFATLQQLKNNGITPAAFLALVPAGVDASQYGGDIVAWVTNPANYANIMGLITVSNPTDPGDLCSGDQLQFRYANPDNTVNLLHGIDFVRMIRFIRLWRKLGYSIEQTDHIISALYPAANLPTGANEAADLLQLDAGFIALIPRLGFALQLVTRLNLTPDDLDSLLACWAPIGTAGDNSLYASMFLSATVANKDTAFADDGYGNFLKSNSQFILPHEATLRSAFNLTGAEFDLIAAALNINSNTVLDLPGISAIFRRGWLARALKLSVVELLELIVFTGLDPFAAPDFQLSGPVEPPVIRLVRFVESLKDAGLAPVQALYLIWNHDLTGKAAPLATDITTLAHQLRADFADVESQFTLVDDPQGEIARKLMALVYGNDAASFFFGLLNNALTVSTPYSAPQSTVAQAVLDASLGRLAYDDFRKLLTWSGVLDAAALAAVNAAAAGDAALLAAIAALNTANHKAVDPFFATYPELLPLYVAYSASNADLPTRRNALLANFLPGLKQLRKHEQALDIIASAAGVDPAFAPALLDDPAVLHAASGPGAALVNDLTALETTGLSAAFYQNNNLASIPSLTADSVAALDYPASAALPAPQGGSLIAARWSGYLDAPQDGFYKISIAADAGATLTLSIDGAGIPLALSNGAWINQAPISLTAGTLAAVAISAANLSTHFTVSWETTGMGWQVIPPASQYSATLVDHLGAAYARFVKAASLATALALTADETAYLASNTDLAVTGDAWLNRLAVTGDCDASIAPALRDVLTAVLNFARMKKALSPDDERLLACLQNPGLILPSGDNALLSLTGWDQASLNSLLTQFFGNTQSANLAHLANFTRVYDSFAVVTTCGIAAGALIAAVSNNPTQDMVTGLQAALRAIYAEPDWLAVIKPINDTMRDIQRDALVAYVLQKLGDQPATNYINTPDKLFEYFLTDVQMEPCTQTSRIRHALSNVQLFIERCLRGLEQLVEPADLDAQQWVWMKRYRVWQANREVFLWPENWLDPELRDDQSQFFKEAVTELLQSDITDDSAATAYLNYLTKLEEVAKLETCGMYYIPSDPGSSNEVAHVIARTSGAHRKHYYRRFEVGNWTPWEEMKLDIEDTPIIPVVWNNRLFVFWLRILKQAPVDPNAMPAPSKDPTTFNTLTMGGLQTALQPNIRPLTVQAVLNWSEYYNGKWQPTKTSDINRPTTIGTFDASGDGAFDRSIVRLRAGSPSTIPAGALAIEIGVVVQSNMVGFGAPGFVLYNTHSLPVRSEDITYSLPPVPPTRVIFTQDPANAAHDLGIMYIPAQPYNGPWYGNSILSSAIGNGHIETEPNLPANAVWDAPFFFADSRHSFYVTTSEQMTSVWEYDGYGIPSAQIDPQAANIPPIVLAQKPGLPDKAGPVMSGINVAVGDYSSSIQRFVSEDAYIRTGIGTTGVVTYGNLQIGPSGSLPAAPAQAVNVTNLLGANIIGANPISANPVSANPVSANPISANPNQGTNLKG
jgi:hypothetical protein